MKKVLFVLIVSVSSFVMAHRIDELESAIKASDLDLVTKLVSKRALKKDDLHSLLDLAENMIILRKSKFECASCASSISEKRFEAQESLSELKKNSVLLVNLTTAIVGCVVAYVVQDKDWQDKVLYGLAVSMFWLYVFAPTYALKERAIVRRAISLYRQDFDNAIAIRQILMRHTRIEATV